MTTLSRSRWEELMQKKKDSWTQKDVLEVLGDRNDLWATAALIDGSLGYITPGHAKNIIRSLRDGETTEYSEGCMAMFGGDLIKMVGWYFSNLMWKEKIDPAGYRILMDRTEAMINIKDDIGELTAGLMYPSR